MINLKELLSIDAPISFKLRIHLSATPIDTLYPRDITQGNEPVNKPNGLWYGFGREWIDFQRKEIGVKTGKYIYFVRIKQLDRILGLHNNAQMYQFLDKYYSKPLIDWEKVSADYAGIEISPWQGKLYRETAKMSWYGAWDIASGCVWDTNVIELKLIYPKQ